MFRSTAGALVFLETGAFGGHSDRCFRSRRLSAATCSDDGCGIVSGLGSTSECIGTSNLGQGTFPYFSIDSRVNHGSFDTDSVGSAKTIGGSAGRFATDSGYVFDYETPESVVEKARAATMLCTAGLSSEWHSGSPLIQS